jgi:FMN phosphatase YigB (HAD superfamily)
VTPGPAESLRGVGGITFDFGNTLVRVDRAGLRSVVHASADVLVERGIVLAAEPFLAAWATERDRQFRLQVPRLLEVDLAERVRHVLAGLRGATVPARDDEPWNEAAAAAIVEPAEVDLAVETYSARFVATMEPVADADSTVRSAHEAGFRLAVLSNWPLARTVDRYVESHGWAPFFDAIVVSERVGVIKPHPAIFDAAAEQLRLPPRALLHVGDDWAADVVGAARAGWHVAYLRGHQGDTPLPTSARGAEGAGAGDGSNKEPDLEIDALAELLPALRARA